MRTRITRSLLENSKPSVKPYFIRSNTITGFGVKVTTGGKISFIVEARRDRDTFRKTIGHFPSMAIEDAESIALSLLAETKTRRGGDEVVQTGLRDDDHSFNGTECCEDNWKPSQLTLHVLCETYLSTVKLKPYTIENYRRVVCLYLKDWQEQPIVLITKAMVEQRFYTIRDKGIFGRKPSQSQAALTMRILSALMNYAIADEVIENNPVHILKHKRVDRSVPKRETYLDHEEVSELLTLIAGDSSPAALAIQLILHTGLRRNEALQLKWQDIETVHRLPCILIRDTKNHRPHCIPITDTIQGILDKAKNDTRFIFNSKFKTDSALSSLRPVIRKIVDDLGVQFTPHDLRRTFATRAAEVGVDYGMIKRILNHKTNDITDQYIQWRSKENLRKMKTALEAVVY